MLTMREELAFFEFRFIEYQTHLEMVCSIICNREQKPFDIIFHLAQAVLGSVIDFGECFDEAVGAGGTQGAGGLFKERKLLAVFPRVLERLWRGQKSAHILQPHSQPSDRAEFGRCIELAKLSPAA